MSNQQQQVEQQFRLWLQHSGFYERGLFFDLQPQPAQLMASVTKLSRGQRVLLGFFLTVYDPALKRQYLPDLDVLAEVQALSLNNRRMIADWLEQPFYIAAGL